MQTTSENDIGHTTAAAPEHLFLGLTGTARQPAARYGWRAAAVSGRDRTPAGMDITHVLGDVGGRLEIFRRTLISIGIDPDFPVIPAGLTLVQVGDIVRLHDSPVFDNAGCLALAARLALLNPHSYTQLWGNHEYGAVNWQFPGSPWQLPATAVRDLPALMGPWAGSIAAAVGNTLITHAGLTQGRWVALGLPATAQAAADVLNNRRSSILRRRAPLGWILNGRRASMFTDCLWAEAATETYPSWLPSGAAMPFDQVHGHDTPFNYDRPVQGPHSGGCGGHTGGDRPAYRPAPACRRNFHLCGLGPHRPGPSGAMGSACP